MHMEALEGLESTKTNKTNTLSLNERKAPLRPSKGAGVLEGLKTTKTKALEKTNENPQLGLSLEKGGALDQATQAGTQRH